MVTERDWVQMWPPLMAVIKYVHSGTIVNTATAEIPVLTTLGTQALSVDVNAACKYFLFYLRFVSFDWQNP